MWVLVWAQRASGIGHALALHAVVRPHRGAADWKLLE